MEYLIQFGNALIGVAELDEGMATFKRGALNALRNPIRMVIVALLLGLCLMFVAA